MALFNKKKTLEEELLTSFLKNAPSTRDILAKSKPVGGESPVPKNMRGSTVDRQSSYKNNIDTDVLNRIQELEASTGVPFGNQPTGNPFNLTTSGTLQGVVKNNAMPYDNQPRALFPDEVKRAGELATTSQGAVPQVEQPTTQSQSDTSQDRLNRINQLIALGKAMNGDENVDEMIVSAILSELTKEGENRTDNLAQAYQLTQDPLIGEEFAKGLYSELGIDPIAKQKEQMLMEKFLGEFEETPETADIFEAVRRNPNLVEQYFKMAEEEGKGFLGLNNTEAKRQERMRRLMGVQ